MLYGRGHFILRCQVNAKQLASTATDTIEAPSPTTLERMTTAPLSIAIIGAGIAGSGCAQSLHAAGHRVTVIDKSRGIGGRLSTRRTDWLAPDGQTHTLRFDHGAQYFTARDASFIALCERGIHEGWIAPWQSQIVGEADQDERRLVAVPDMPQLCRRLLDGIDTQVNTQITELRRLDAGWQLVAGEAVIAPCFDAVVLAIPPAQAAPLMAQHDADRAAKLAATVMLPCWTLMALTQSAPAFDAARIPDGPLAWIARNETKPGRTSLPGYTQWVAQTRDTWSLAHKDTPKDQVEAELKTALAHALGQPALQFHYSSVHRWLYAHPQNKGAGPWWDASRGLGLCGDHTSAGRVESAYLSGTELARLMLS